MTSWGPNWTQSPLSDLLSASFDGAWGDDDDGSCRAVQVLRSTDMRGGKIDLSKVATRVVPEAVIQKKKLLAGDILVNKSSGSAHLVGASVFFLEEDDEIFLCSNFIRCLRPNKARIDPQYLHYAILSKQFRSQVFQAQRTTSGLRNIKIDDFQSAVVGYPPMQEQRRIVSRINECMDRLDEIETLREDTCAQRAYLAESVVESELGGLQGDAVSMSDVCGITSSLVDPREAQYKSMLHVGGANIESRTGRLVDLKTAAEEGLKSGKFLFDCSVVLYNKIRPYLMKAARPDFSGLCSADMYPLSPRIDRATRDFIYYVLMSRRFTDYAIEGSNRAGMPKVNREHLFAYRFKLPPIEAQRRVCEQLDRATSAAIELGHEMTKASQEANGLREAILRRAFAGEL